MPWMALAAVAVAGILSSFTDWLFMGVLFHERYQRYPEVWWPRDKANERGPIIYSTALGFITAAAVVALCAFAGTTDLKGALTVAVLAWAAGPLVTGITNQFWVKFDPLVTLAHALGYLVRFLIAGAAYALLV